MVDASFYLLIQLFAKAGLTIKQTKIMLWRYYNGLSLRQAAELDEISPNTVFEQEKAALKKLRRLNRRDLLAVFL